ncbi:MAG TPA: YigZ family protein, partial [Prolixibacteraceae bacterium]|nr:YigZ family protein [Prolixibacteraceae bacterium]
EPSSTAGKPILGQLQSRDITNTLIDVVPYFGGTLLSTSGLINAYRSAAEDALKNAQIVTKTIEKKFRLDFSYNEMKDIMLLIKQNNLTILTTKFEETCSLMFSVRKSEAKRIQNIFSDFYGVRISTTE